MTARLFAVIIGLSTVPIVVADLLQAPSDAPQPATGSPTPTAKPVATAAPRPPVVLTDEARRIHAAALLFDGHNDLPGEIRSKGDSSFDKLDISKPQPQLQTDIPRLKQGGLGAQFWSAYVPSSTIKTGGATRYGLEQIDLVHRMVRRYPDAFELALTADDIVRIRASGKIASLIGVEGGHAIENSLGVLRTFHDLGVRYITLTHSDTLDWADSATDEARHGGLTEFGEQVVLEMNRRGMLVDISHVSADTMRDVLRVTRSPVIASHSSAYALAEHPRNVPDDILREIKPNGGVIMVNFYSGFVDAQSAIISREAQIRSRELRATEKDEAAVDEAMKKWFDDHPRPRGTVHTVVDHIDHIVKVAGIDHVGIGSDFDGVDLLPEQLEDVSCFPYITQELLNRGYSEPDIHKILGANALRALRQAESVARDWKN
ncbi:MAG: membrane dipeptidase [Phycisphaerales bacterium]|nr:membrane dipeptidase [Phycisphaerales bacterium]